VLRGEHVEPEAARQERRRQLPLDAVSGLVEKRRERAEAALPGATVTMPPPMPLFPGNPMS
jgi:hypothetical protein